MAEPARLAEQPGALEALSPLLGATSWQKFVERNGFDLRATRETLAAGFDFGTLYLIGEDSPAVQRRFRERLLRGEVFERPHPRLTRVSGVVGETPQAMLRAEGRLVALATGDVTLVRLVEGFLLGRFRKTPAALSGAALRAHATFASDAPLRLWVPRPLDATSWAFLPPGAFADATAAMGAVSLFEAKSCPCRGGESTDGLAVRLQLAVAGPWDPKTASASPLADAWQALAASTLGHLLHLDSPLRAPQLAVHPTDEGCRLHLTVELPLAPLAEGLQNVLAGELRQLFPVPPEPGSPAAAFRQSQ